MHCNIGYDILGSPPQVRGKLFSKKPAGIPTGITPAGAGKTLINEPDVVLVSGSPPQVRGKRVMGFWLSLRAGITPAGAGKTRSLPGKRLLTQDHPRRCGENGYSDTAFKPPAGSPPQVRGKPQLRTNGFRRIGITPAGAGKTGCRDATGKSRKDHPRRCGENSPSSAKKAAAGGSPPQVRGKLNDLDIDEKVAWITPAGAGKTVYRFCFCLFLQDHPRRCGENHC